METTQIKYFTNSILFTPKIVEMWISSLLSELNSFMNLSSFTHKAASSPNSRLSDHTL